MPHKTFDNDNDPVIAEVRAQQAEFFRTNTKLGNCLKEVLPKISERAIWRVYEKARAQELELLKTTVANGDVYANPTSVEAWVKSREAEVIIYPRRKVSQVSKATRIPIPNVPLSVPVPKIETAHLSNDDKKLYQLGAAVYGMVRIMDADPLELGRFIADFVKPAPPS